MIKAILLNSDAQLNNFIEINKIDYVPGEKVKVVIRLKDSQLDIRRVSPTGSAIELKFLKASDGTFLTKAATVVDALDRSMWSVELTSAETNDLASGNIQVEEDVLDDDSDVRITVIYNALAKQVFSGDC